VGLRRRIVLRTALALALVLAVGPYMVPLPAQPDLEPAALAPPKGFFLEADGARTYVIAEGPVDGPAVLLVHGFGGSTFSWRETIPALADAGYRTIALDLPGFGLSSRSFQRDHSHPAQAAFVSAAMEALGIERATIVGHSMGGSVAAHLALDRPERVEALVLVDASVRAPGENDGPSLGVLLHAPPFRRITQHVARRWATPERVTGLLASAYGEPSFATPEVAEGYLAAQRVRDWDLALLAIIRDGRRNALPEPPAALGRADVPILVIWGEEDPWIPLSTGQALHAEIPTSDWAIIANSGHLPFEEQPEDFMLTLLRFLARVDR
jgi:pimeloyl-ACP methyl ester carboxylesterase